MNNDLISRSELKKAIKDNGYSHYFEIFDIIDNAPTVELNDKSLEIARKSIEFGRNVGKLEGKLERPQSRCKTCKYYHPYCEQFSDKPRGDGYCVIARMTPEGMTTINCNDEFGCSDYQEGEEE